MKTKEIILSIALTTGCASHKTLKLNEGYQRNRHVVGCVESKSKDIAKVESINLARYYAGLINATVEMVNTDQILIKNPNIIGTKLLSFSYTDGLACSTVHAKYQYEMAQYEMAQKTIYHFEREDDILRVCSDRTGDLNGDLNELIKKLLKENNYTQEQIFRIVDINTNQYGVCMNYLKEKKDR